MNNKTKNYEHILDPLGPIYDSSSKVLLLGSMPSPESRRIGMYYGNNKNRFWKVLSDILNAPFPTTNAAKKELLLNNHIAVWDVIESCDIVGSNDNKIKNALPNDISLITSNAPIKAIFTLGKTATKLLSTLTNLTSIPLPSTSPANCALPYAKLKEEFSKILQYLN